jgi:hypothetical protein
MSLRSTSFAAAFALLGALSAFGSAAAQATKPAQGDACSLVTKEDAAAALGGAATGPKVVSARDAGAGATVSGCGYSGPGVAALQVNLTRVPAANAPMYRATCDKKTKDGLAGLGDLACWYNEKHEELHAFKGTSFVSVELRGVSAPTEAIIGVMKKALARLK